MLRSSNYGLGRISGWSCSSNGRDIVTDTNCFPLSQDPSAISFAYTRVPPSESPWPKKATKICPALNRSSLEPCRFSIRGQVQQRHSGVKRYTRALTARFDFAKASRGFDDREVSFQPMFSPLVDAMGGF